MSPFISFLSAHIEEKSCLLQTLRDLFPKTFNKTNGVCIVWGRKYDFALYKTIHNFITEDMWPTQLQLSGHGNCTYGKREIVGPVSFLACRQTLHLHLQNLQGYCVLCFLNGQTYSTVITDLASRLRHQGLWDFYMWWLWNSFEAPGALSLKRPWLTTGQNCEQCWAALL